MVDRNGDLRAARRHDSAREIDVHVERGEPAAGGCDGVRLGDRGGRRGGRREQDHDGERGGGRGGHGPRAMPHRPVDREDHVPRRARPAAGPKRRTRRAIPAEHAWPSGGPGPAFLGFLGQPASTMTHRLGDAWPPSVCERRGRGERGRSWLRASGPPAAAGTLRHDETVGAPELGDPGARARDARLTANPAQAARRPAGGARPLPHRRRTPPGSAAPPRRGRRASPSTRSCSGPRSA